MNRNRLQYELESKLGGYLEYAYRSSYGWVLMSTNSHQLFIDEYMMYELVGSISLKISKYEFSHMMPITATKDYDERVASSTLSNYYNQAYYQLLPDYYTINSVKASPSKTHSTYNSVDKTKEKKHSENLRKLFWHRFTKTGINPLEQIKC